MSFLHDVSLTFFTALGVVLGGSFVGALASVALPGSPFHTMVVLAKPIKLWAILVALGGTFPTMEAIDSGILGGEVRLLLHQLAMVMSGFIGASLGYWIVVIVAGGE